jgi:phosphomannomutase
MVRKYFGTDGIRGRANRVITPELALKVGQAAGLVFKRGDHRHRVVIGKDTRLSGYMIETALVAGFTSVGMDVLLLGPMPTPAVGMLTRSMRADLGVMISASHNPFDDNGIKLFGPDGFNINKDCGSTDIAALTAKVREVRADIGIALDGDADRILVIDERGHLVDGDQLLAVIAESWKEDGRLAKPGIVATVMSNLGLERHLAGTGLELVRTQVGDRYVLEAMRAGGYNVGGEPSGHIILSDYNTTGDGFVAALQLLAVIRNKQKPVSEVCHRFEPLPQVLKNVRYKAGKPLENAGVKSAISAAEQKLGRGGRLIIRPSGTEPVIRVMGEGDDRVLVETVVDDIVSALSKAAA